MSSQGVAITVDYLAYNSSTGAYVTGDVANHIIKLIKDGTEASPTNSPSEVDSTNAPGVYKLALTGAETSFNAVTVCGKSSTANVIIIPKTYTFEILPTALDSNSNIKTGISYSASTGAVSVQSNVKKNTALSNFPFTMTDSTTHAPVTGKTVTCQLSLDGAAFVSSTNAPTELSNGDYKINLAASDTNANTVQMRFTATGCDDLNIILITDP